MTELVTENAEVIIPKDSLVFIPLGGATGVGMNFFLYGYNFWKEWF